MDLDTARKVNLLEFLEEEHPDVTPPPDDAAETWSEAKIRLHYASGHTYVAPTSLNITLTPQQNMKIPETTPPPDTSPLISAVHLPESHPTSSVQTGQNPASNYKSSTVSEPVGVTTVVDKTKGDAWPKPPAAVVSPELSPQATSQPGGGVVQTEHPDQEQRNAPLALVRNQIAATVAGYRAAVIADGIPFRAHGLFPPYDPILLELARKPGCYPFEKHMAGSSSSYELQTHGGWTTGDAAAKNGLDLRLFWQEAKSGEVRGTLVGAARLGETASIGYGSWSTAHGGAIESLLDEATAELSKMEWSPMVTTIEIEFKIKKPVPLNTSLRIECSIKDIRGIRCWVDGAILDESGLILATCVAQLVDMAQLRR